MLRQLVLFALAGGVATSAHYSILVLLVHAGWSAVAASSAGAVCGAAANYFLNRRYTFRSRRVHAEALPRYLITAAAGFLINAAVVGGLVASHIHYLAAQAAATAMVVAWNFFINRWWTFRGEGYAQ